MGTTGLIIGALLPWALGVAFVGALPRRARLLTQPGAFPWLLGTGMVAGAFLVTLVLRGLAFAGIPFGLFAAGAPVIAIAFVLALVAWRRERASGAQALSSALRTLAGHDLTPGWRVLWLVLLAWLALRSGLLLAEVVLKPVYPWDAWIQWATKARVWYELETIVPFARNDPWFAAGGAVYYDHSPNYPATVPLLMVWTCLSLGRWDDVLMNLPFWQLAMGFALGVYGALRNHGYDPLPALLGTWIVSSLPLADTHVALAGYADLPMAIYFALAALAGLRWARTRELGDGLLALLFVVACPTIKVPGLVWAATLVPGLIVALLPRLGIRLVGLGFAGLAGVLLVLAQTSPRILGYQLHLDFAPAWGSLGSSFFLLGNWHLLWYAVIAVAVLGRRQLLAAELAPLTVVLAAGAAFLFVVFGFTNAREWVADQTTINRAVLHLAPLAAVWMLLVFRVWSRARLPATPASVPA